MGIFRFWRNKMVLRIFAWLGNKGRGEGRRLILPLPPPFTISLLPPQQQFSRSGEPEKGGVGRILTDLREGERSFRMGWGG